MHLFEHVCCHARFFARRISPVARSNRSLESNDTSILCSTNITHVFEIAFTSGGAVGERGVSNCLLKWTFQRKFCEGTLQEEEKPVAPRLSLPDLLKFCSATGKYYSIIKLASDTEILI
jgi:hypothetical protein